MFFFCFFYWLVCSPHAPTSLVSSGICRWRVQGRACPSGTCPPTSRCGPASVHGKKGEISLRSPGRRAGGGVGGVSPVRCRVCRGSAAVWSQRVRGPACSPREGSPPSGSARSEPGAPPSASSDLGMWTRGKPEFS